jgi:predicted ATPase
VKRVLITGMPGAGKSSLLHELAARGYRTVEVVTTVPVAQVADIVLGHEL